AMAVIGEHQRRLGQPLSEAQTRSLAGLPGPVLEQLSRQLVPLPPVPQAGVRPRRVQVRRVYGRLETSGVEAIVNAANPQMAVVKMAGVSGALQRHAGQPCEDAIASTRTRRTLGQGSSADLCAVEADGTYVGDIGA